MATKDQKEEADPLVKILTWAKIIGATVSILIAVSGAFIAYVSSSLVSRESFSSYREEQLSQQNNFKIDFIKSNSEAIEKSLRPISEKISKIDDKVATVEARVQQISSVIGGSDLVRSKDYNEFLRKNAAEKERLTILIESIKEELDYLKKYAPSKDQYDFLGKRVEDLEKKLDEVSQILKQNNNY